MKNKINTVNVRGRILSDSYGKFDLIEIIYSKEELLNTKPRILLKNIIDRFSIPEDAINRKTFWSWHLRFKKKYSQESSSASKFQIEKSEPGKTLQLSEDWREFEPSNAETLKQDKAVIKIIK